MKSLTTFFIIISQVVCIYSQKDTLTTDVNWPLGLDVRDDILYIVESTNNEISKLNLDDINSTPETFLTELDNPGFIKIDNNTLYIIERGTNLSTGKISKIDLTETNPVPVPILSGLNKPKSLLIINSVLYYTESNTISKIDLTQAIPTPINILSDLDGVINLATDGQNLYYSEYLGNKISKISLSAPNPEPITIISNLNGPLGGMLINDEKLYFFEYGISTISTVDLSNLGSEKINIDVGVSAGDLLINNNKLYVSDFENDLILVYRNLISSISKPVFSRLNIFPNPAIDFIEISGRASIPNYLITTDDGKILFKNKKSNENRIDISSFPMGIYFLIFETGETYKFLKL